MRRILFVDDEQQVLDGLRDLLRKQRKQWDMVFALGGEQALVELARKRFDVVVSDMQMPGIDGVTLLRTVKELYPTAARIVLSGHAERDTVIRALPVAHQFLSKPCDVDLLRGVIERASGLQALLEDEQVRTLIGRVERLPSVPEVYRELIHALERSDVSLAHLATIVERDAAMAVKVLQLVNSSFFGPAQKQASVRQAVAFLGVDLLKSMVLTAQVFASAEAAGIASFSLDALQQHSLLVARLATRLLPDKERAAETYVAALVHDIGKIVLAMSIPEQFKDVVANSVETNRPAHVVEKERLGLTHAEVGAYLLGLWGLPIGIVEAVAYHHRPELVAPTDTLIAVHVADALSHLSGVPAADPSLGGRLNLELLERSPYGAELPRWRVLAEEELRAENDGCDQTG